MLDFFYFFLSTTLDVWDTRTKLVLIDEIPIILGRPFLAIVGAIIDVKNRHITYSFGGKMVEFEQDHKGTMYCSSNHQYGKNCINYGRKDTIKTTIREGFGNVPNIKVKEISFPQCAP